MQTPTNRSGFVRSLGIAVTLAILLAPLSATAQSAAAPAPGGCALPTVLHSVLPPSGWAAPMLDAPVRRALDRAVAMLNAQSYADARALVEEVKLGWLAAYELAMAEGVLFRIARAEQKYGEARQHLVNAIASCGLSEQAVADAQDAIKQIDELLAAAPSP